jgi:hypothetical protein
MAERERCLDRRSRSGSRASFRPHERSSSRRLSSTLGMCSSIRGTGLESKWQTTSTTRTTSSSGTTGPSTTYGTSIWEDHHHRQAARMGSEVLDWTFRGHPRRVRSAEEVRNWVLRLLKLPPGAYSFGRIRCSCEFLPASHFIKLWSFHGLLIAAAPFAPQCFLSRSLLATLHNYSRYYRIVVFFFPPFLAAHLFRHIFSMHRNRLIDRS